MCSGRRKTGRTGRRRSAPSAFGRLRRFRAPTALSPVARAPTLGLMVFGAFRFPAFALPAIRLPAVPGPTIWSRQVPTFENDRTGARVGGVDQRFCCRDDQRQMCSYELAPIGIRHSRRFFEAEKCADCFVRDADGPHFPIDPDIDERVGPAGPYRISFHRASPRYAQAMPRRWLHRKHRLSSRTLLKRRRRSAPRFASRGRSCSERPGSGWRSDASSTRTARAPHGRPSPRPLAPACPAQPTGSERLSPW